MTAPLYRAEFNEKRGWRVVADYTGQGGSVIDICGAASEPVARDTAAYLAVARSPGGDRL